MAKLPSTSSMEKVDVIWEVNNKEENFPLHKAPEDAIQSRSRDKLLSTFSPTDLPARRHRSRRPAAISIAVPPLRNKSTPFSRRGAGSRVPGIEHCARARAVRSRRGGRSLRAPARKHYHERQFFIYSAFTELYFEREENGFAFPADLGRQDHQGRCVFGVKARTVVYFSTRAFGLYPNHSAAP
ncbi:Protein of unknown function [Gryllus bimaculatus]|nr:Protein of unknown function [Gryllus bimaculatus]